MNWVSSSLELAGSLLESVDQQAALTLAGAEDEAQDADLLVTVRVSQTSEGNTANTTQIKNPEESATEEVAVSTDDASSTSPTNITGASHTRSTPPQSNSGNKMVDFVSAISMQMENVSSGRGGDPPLSSSESHLASTEECAQLHQELARLKNDLRLKEKQLASTQKSMQICEEELVALEQECKEKIAQVQHEVSVIQQDKNSDEQNFIQALDMKDQQVRAMQINLDALTEAKVKYTDEIVSLKAELAKAVESKDTLWTSAASASNESEQLVESLRSELQDTLTAMNNLKREYAESKNTMFTRQSQLESTNTELVNSVANLERELAKAKEAAAATSQTSSTGGASLNASSGSPHFGVNSNFASMNDDYRRVQQTLVLTKKSLHDESRKIEVQKQEIIALTEEVRRLKQALKTAQDNFSTQLKATTQENKRMKEQVNQLALHSSAAAAANGELRIQRLTNRLIEKQETIDSLRSRVTTMEVRLQDVTLRAQRAEEELARMEQNGAVDDMEMATPVGKLGMRGMRSRTNRMAHMISQVAPVVERSHRVLTALDVLDRWLLFLGRVFLQAPFARLAMLCYVVLIHFWVSMILSFHTSHLTEEMQLSTAGDNAVMEPGEDMIPGGGH